MELILRKRIFLTKLAELLAVCERYKMQVAARSELQKYGLTQHHDEKYGHLNPPFPFEFVNKVTHLVNWGIKQGWLPEKFKTIEYLRAFTSSAPSSVSFASVGPMRPGSQGPVHMAGAISSPGVMVYAKPSLAPLVMRSAPKQGAKK